MVPQLATVVLAITVIACTPPRLRGAPSGDTPENQALLAKLKGYQTCLDDHSGRVFELADDYTRRLGGSEPAPEARVPVHASPDPTTCVEAIAEARMQPPASPALEAAGDAFARALEAVHASTGGRDRSEQRAPPGPAAPAAAPHARLSAAFRELDRAHGALFDEVRRLDLSVRRDQLARTEQKEGRTLTVLIDRLLLRAEEMIPLAATPVDRLEQLDVAAAEAQLAAFEDTFAETNAASATSSKDDPKDVQSRRAAYATFARHARAFLVATRQLIQRARDKLAFTEAERIMIAADNEREVVGTPAALAAAYNKLVEVYYYAK